MYNETYVLDMSYIFSMKIVGFKKERKKEAMQDLCHHPLMAKDPLPSAADDKEATRHPPVLPAS